MQREAFTIAGLGEVLWDIFPEAGMVAGGAPANFACHAAQLGARGFLASAVGDDGPGRELLDVFASRGADTSCVATLNDKPTGVVRVTLGAGGKPAYDIAAGAAWDHVPFGARMRALAARADAVCFGTLAQRSPRTRATVRSFLGAMRAQTLKVFDINLRQQFWDRDVIVQSLELSNVLKLNDDELPVVANLLGISGTQERMLAELAARFGLEAVALTKGEHGCLLRIGDQTVCAPGVRPPRLVDTVGAGDAFTAVLTVGMLRKMAAAQVAAWANDVAAFVCSQAGATPELPRALSRDALGSETIDG